MVFSFKGGARRSLRCDHDSLSDIHHSTQQTNISRRHGPYNCASQGVGDPNSLTLSDEISSRSDRVYRSTHTLLPSSCVKAAIHRHVPGTEDSNYLTRVFQPLTECHSSFMSAPPKSYDVRLRIVRHLPINAIWNHVWHSHREEISATVPRTSETGWCLTLLAIFIGPVLTGRRTRHLVTSLVLCNQRLERNEVIFLCVAHIYKTEIPERSGPSQRQHLQGKRIIIFTIIVYLRGNMRP